MSEVNGLKNICLFLVTVYVKSWLESSSAIGAPLNDLMFLKMKYENINQGISSIALKTFCNHLWYLNEESSILAIFDKNVNIASKKHIIENLKRENLHTERKCIVQPNEVPLLLGPHQPARPFGQAGRCVFQRVDTSEQEDNEYEEGPEKKPPSAQETLQTLRTLSPISS
ncbi:hypothetical protein AVEN_24242-1 [Araneus ventricosus]|uniref:Uncharacterized protein n=1 Tax=Araneus ventricosus TaxID=182803 RepID=A0A4Y2G183_ARAVE|nr:hypothetical protein AVEN_24242-1 [Araneus ventricosus]